MHSRITIVKRFQHGITYVEVLVSVTITAILVGALMNVIGIATNVSEEVRNDNDLMQQVHYAIQQMVSNTSRTRKLLLPLEDNPTSNWPEHIREETVPPSPPIGSSVKATAVLAVTLPADIDLDGDGFPDADDDEDGLIDEDLPNDIHHDFFPGIMLIDDDGDGLVDDGSGWAEDDEGGSNDEDPIDGIDNENDGSIDEDPPSDNNGDGCPGICGVDDDADGSIDEGNADDDDEDGGSFDDPYDPVVFYLNGNSLIQRIPVPWNEDGISTPDGPVDGRDFVENILAENVTHFRIERVPTVTGSVQLVDILLELTNPTTGERYSLQTQVRVGAAL